MDFIEQLGYYVRLVVAVLAASLLLRAWFRLLKRRSRAEGWIESTEPGITRRSRTGGGPPAWRTSSSTATICFDVFGTLYRCTHDYFPENREFREGDRVAVLYDPDQPMNAKLDGGKLRYNELTILSILLLLFVWFLVL